MGKYRSKTGWWVQRPHLVAVNIADTAAVPHAGRVASNVGHMHGLRPDSSTDCWIQATKSVPCAGNAAKRTGPAGGSRLG